MTLEDVRNSQGERLDVAFHPGAEGRRDVCVLGHGVTGNKDRPLLVALAERLEEEGIAALRVSFAGNGDSEGRFEDATVSKEVDDLGAVLDALAGWRVAYVGHSMGAAVGVRRAATDRRIHVLVSLAGMVRTEHFAQRKFGTLTPGRDVMWDKPECPLSQTFVDDMTKIASVLPQAAAIEIPWLLVHGTDDTVVPLRDSQDVVKLGKKNVRLVEIPGADHVFTGDATPQMVDAVAPWLAAQWRG